MALRVPFTFLPASKPRSSAPTPPVVLTLWLSTMPALGCGFSSPSGHAPCCGAVPRAAPPKCRLYTPEEAEVMVDGLPRREVVMREQAPGASATHHIEDRASRISRKGCTLGRPEALGMGRWGSIRAHSASERSVWYALLTSCPVSYRATTSRSLFRRFLIASVIGIGPAHRNRSGRKSLGRLRP
jgi:hypothetical protein